MTINEYLAKHDMTHREFGQLVGLTEAMVSHYTNNRHSPRMYTALRIEQATGGEVTRADLLPELFEGFARR